MRLRAYLRMLEQNVRENRKVFIIWTVLRVLVLAVMVRAAFMGHWESVGIGALTLVLLVVPSFIERRFSLDIPPMLEVAIYSFVFAAEILGEINHFYVRIPFWDTMLHTINGFLAAAVGFSIVYLLNRKNKNFSLSAPFVAVVSLCFSMTIGVCWEFVEYGADLFLGQDMQKDFVVQGFQSVTLDPNHDQQVVAVRDIAKTTIETASGETYVVEGYLDIGINDTMKDLLVNFVGALVFSLWGYLLARDRGASDAWHVRVARELIVRPRDWGDASGMGKGLDSGGEKSFEQCV